MPTPTMCYLWYHQGKDKWAVTPMNENVPGVKHIYSDRVTLSAAFVESFTISNGKRFGLPVNHALVCCVDLD